LLDSLLQEFQSSRPREAGSGKERPNRKL